LCFPVRDGWLPWYDVIAKNRLAFSTTLKPTIPSTASLASRCGIDGMGPTIANGMVYIMSGFNGAARTGGNASMTVDFFGRRR